MLTSLLIIVSHSLLSLITDDTLNGGDEMVDVEYEGIVVDVVVVVVDIFLILKNFFLVENISSEFKSMPCLLVYLYLNLAVDIPILGYLN